MHARALIPKEFFVESEPCSEASGDEIVIFEAAYKNKLLITLSDGKPDDYNGRRGC